MRANLHATAIAIVLISSSCHMMPGNHFEIVNKTGHEIRGIRINFADAAGEHEALADGETFSFRPSPRHDGGISISYIENGKVAKHELGYVTPPISMTCKFDIISNDVRGACK